MRIRIAVPQELDDYEREQVLNAALEATTIADEGLVRRGLAPPAAHAIKSGLVRWQAEPPGDEHFDLSTTVMGRKWGDCDDLAPWHAASLRATGRDDKARAFVRRSGPQRWHALVRRGDGTIEDPSVHAGMRGSSVSGVGVDGAPPAIVRPMQKDGSLAVCVAPTSDPRHPCVWFARCDLPCADRGMTWSASAHVPPGLVHPFQSPKTALLSAIRAAKEIAGEDADEADFWRLAALEDRLEGASAEELAEALDESAPDELDVDQVVGETITVGDFFSDAFKTVSKPFKSVAKAVSPVARFAAPLFAGSPAAGLMSQLATGDPMAMLTAMHPGMRGQAMQQGANVPAFMRAKEFFSKHPLGPAALPIAQTMLPTMFPGFGSMFMGLATPGGMQTAAPPPMQQGPVQQLPPGFMPEWSMEPHAPFFPMGGMGPMVMRF